MCRIGLMMAPIAGLPPRSPARRSHRGERVVAKLGQDVAGPADDLAGLRQGGALAVLAVLDLRVVGVVGGGAAGTGLTVYSATR